MVVRITRTFFHTVLQHETPILEININISVIEVVILLEVQIKKIENSFLPVDIKKKK